MKTRKSILAFMAVLVLSLPMAFAVGPTDMGSIGSSGDVGVIEPPDKYHAPPPSYDPNVDSPNWSSGSGSTHQFIVEKSVAILNRSFYGPPVSNYGMVLKAGADWPDTSESDGITFAGHFYDPDKQASYTGNTSAKDRLVGWYTKAVSTYKSGDTVTGMSYLGRALHYAADLSTPHHAANKIALGSHHTAYEDWARNNQTKYVVSSTTSSTYTWARNTTVANMGHNFAINAKALINDANSGTESGYAAATAIALPKAQRNCAAILYKFCVDVGLIA